MDHKPFGSLFDFLPKSPLKASDGASAGAYPFFTSSEIQQRRTDTATFTGEALVFGTGGSASVHHVNGSFSTSGDCIVAMAKDRESLLARYCYHYLSSNVRVLEAGFRGAGLKHISKKYIEALDIPLPSSEEQRSLADILDSAAALLARRRLALAQLDDLERSLFIDLFGDPFSNPRSWPEHSLEDLLSFRTGKLDSNAAVDGGEYPFFTCARDHLWIDNCAFDDEVLLLPGNNASGDYWVKYYVGKFNAYQRTYVITLLDHTNSYQYLRLVLEQRLGELKQISKGTNTKYLTKALLNALRIPVPPSDLQREFDRRVGAVDGVRATHAAALAEHEALIASLRDRAFNSREVT